MDEDHIDLMGKKKSQSQPSGKTSESSNSGNSGKSNGGFFDRIKKLFSQKIVGESKEVVAMRSLSVGGEGDEPFDVNLIPGAENAATKQKQFRILGSTALITIGLMLIAYLLFAYQRSQLQGDISGVMDQLTATETIISELQPMQKDALELRDRIVVADYVLDQHLYWTEVLNEIESLTLPTVTYSNFVADQGGSISLTATTSSFDDVAQQLGVFEEAETVINVKISGVAGVYTSTLIEGEEAPEENVLDEVTFSISLDLDPKLFSLTPSENASK